MGTTIFSYRDGYGAGGRSYAFMEYLERLPRAERQQIQAAERLFLAKREAPFSWERRALRDFDDSMRVTDLDPRTFTC